MLRGWLKKRLKTSLLVFNLLTVIIYLYIRFVYATTKWRIIFPASATSTEILRRKKTLFALWHNQLAFFLKPFAADDNIAALTSAHSDGQIIGRVIELYGYQIIKGSTNKNPTGAVKHIIDKINNNGRVVITPDGPRGPKHQVHSVITKIAYKYGASIIPIACSASKYFTLNSWDQMLIPKPFGTVVIIFGEAIKFDSGHNQNDLLTEALNNLSIQAKELLEQ